MEYWAPGLAAAVAATGGCGSKGAAAARRRRTCVKGAQAEKENRQEALGAQAVSGAGPARGQQQDAERERVLGLARGWAPRAASSRTPNASASLASPAAGPHARPAAGRRARARPGPRPRLGPARGQQQDAERERVLGLARGQPVSKRIGFRVSLGGPVAEPPLARGLRSRKRRGRRVESVHQRLPGLV